MRFTKQHLILGILGAIILSIGCFYWLKTSHDAQGEVYRTQKVGLGNLIENVTANGNLSPVTLVSVGAQVTGKVRKIYVDFNDRVKEGEVLLELDATLYQAQVAQSSAGVQKAQTALELATNDFNRGKVLYQRRGITKQNLEQLLQTMQSAAADLQMAQAKLGGDRANLDYATIRSPVSGVVVNRQVDIGQTVTATFQTPVLFQIAEDLSKMQIDTSFAEADVAKITSHQSATFTVDAFPGRIFSGSVQQIRLTPSVQQNVVTYNVVIKVDNPDGILLPGMTAYVTVKTAEHKNVLLVPSSAIRFKSRNEDKEVKTGLPNTRQHFVYTMVNNKLKAVSCKIGISDSNYTEIFATELKVGDEVVTSYVPQKSDDNSSSFRLRMM